MREFLSALSVRMPDKLRDAVTQSAKANDRSVSGEIVHRLAMSFENPTLDERLVRDYADKVFVIAMNYAMKIMREDQHGKQEGSQSRGPANGTASDQGRATKAGV